MPRKRIFWIAVSLFVLPFSICWHTDAQDSDLKGFKIYDSDEVATHYYDPDRKIFLTKDVVYVWVTIVGKHGNLGLLKQIYVGPGSCDEIDFSDLGKMGAPIEMNCSEKRYRVIGGAFYRREAIIKCEPPEEFVKWMDIPSKSAIKKLSKIICP